MNIFKWIKHIFSRKKNKLGFKVDPIDDNDIKFDTNDVFFPPKNKGFANLREHMPPVINQGSIGTCVPSVLTAMVYHSYAKKDIVKIFSRLFLYYEGRKRNNDTDIDSGMYFRNGLKSISKKGICIEKEWPYNVRRYAWKPNKECYKNAKEYKIKKYWRINSLRNIKDCLDDGFPVAMGIKLYKRSWSDAQINGMLYAPTDDEKPIGGHAVLITGYDDSNGNLLCRNSLGMNWGIDGHFFVGYNYINNPELVTDMWTLRI